MANVRQGDEGEELIELSLAVAALLNHIEKQPVKKNSPIYVLSDKVREEVLKEKLHVRRLQGENISLRTCLECHLKEVEKGKWLTTLVRDIIRENNVLKQEVKRPDERKKAIQFLQTEIERLDLKCRDLERNNCELIDQNEERVKQTVLIVNDQLSQMNDLLQKTQAEMHVKDNVWWSLFNPLQTKVKHLQGELEERDIKIEGLEEMLKQKDQQNQHLKMHEKEIQFSEKNKSLEIEKLREEIRHRDLRLIESEVKLNKKSIELDANKKFDDKSMEKRNDDTSEKRQMKYLKSKLEDHERYKKQLEDTFKSKDIEIKAMSNRNRIFESDLEDTYHKLRKLQDSENKLLRMNTSLKEKTQVIETKLKHSNLNENDLEEQLESMRTDITVGNERLVSRVNGKDKQLSELNDQLKQAFNQLHEESTKHCELIISLKNENMRLVEQLGNSDLKVHNLEKMLEDKKNEIRNRNAKIENTNVQEKDYQITKLNVQLQQTLKSLRVKEAEISVSVESREKELDVECNGQTVSDLKETVSKTKVKMSQMSNRNEILENEMKKKDAEIYKLRAERNRTSKTLQETETRTEEILNFHTKTIQDLEMDIKHRDLKVYNLEKSLDNLRIETSDENKQLLKKMDEQDTQFLEQKEQLEHALNLLRDKETECLELQGRKQSLEEELNGCHLKMDNLEIILSSKNTEFKYAREQLAKEIVKQKDDQTSELRDNLQHAFKKLDDKEAEVRNLQLKIECHEQSGNKLQDEISSTKVEIRQMNDKIQHLEDKIRGKDSQLRKLNDQLKNSSQTQQEKETELYKTLSSLKNNNSRLEKEIEVRDRKIRSLEEMLDIIRNEQNGEHELVMKKVKEKEKQLSDQTDQQQATLNQLRKQELESRGIIVSLENQNKVKDERLSDLRKKLDNKDAEMAKYETSQKKKLKDIETETVRREQQISKLEGKLKEKDVAMANIRCRIEQLEKQLNEKDELLSEQKCQHGQTLKQMNEAESNLTLLKKKIQHLHAEIDSRDLKLNNLEKKLQSKAIENTEKVRTAEDVRENEEKIANLKDQLRHALTKLHDTVTELDETKTRLSKAMGDRLTDNNPNITDLSDRNRPTKLAERCAELYDNQWTDAFDILDKYFHSEENVIGALLHILEDVMFFCKIKATEQLEELGRALEFSDRQNKRDDTVDVRKLLKDCRKAVASVAVNNLYQKYVSHLSRSSDETLRRAALEAESYSKECLEICWFMVIQDPPVVFAPLVKKGSSFNTDLYKPYTSSGTRVDFAVWPPLLLHEGGPILAKGVAQGYGKKSK